MTQISLPNSWIAEDDFYLAVSLLPLVSIDLLVFNQQHQLLLGLRNNAPAQDWWFSPGARIRKNESLPLAMQRIWQEELGQSIPWPVKPQLLGAWDHFYSNSRFDESISTHYVNLPHFVPLREANTWDESALPLDQHREWRWMNLQDVVESSEVHEYVRVYAQELLKLFS